MVQGLMVKRERIMRIVVAASRALLVLIVLVSGCKSDSARRQGDALLDQGRFIEAVERYRLAVELSMPENSTLNADELTNRFILTGQKTGNGELDRSIAKLAEAKQAVASYELRQGERELNENEPGRAIEHLRKALGFRPDMEKAGVLLDQAIQQVQRAGEMMLGSLKLASEGSWQEAVAMAENALSLHGSLPGGAKNLSDIRSGAYAHYLEKAREALDQDKRREAESFAQQAASFVAGQEASQIYEESLDRDKAESFAIAGKELVKQGQYSEAADQFALAYKAWSGLPGINEMLVHAQQSQCEQLHRQGVEALDKGEYVVALTLFRQCDQLLEGYGDVKHSLFEANRLLFGRNLQQSGLLEARNYWASAMLYQGLALAYLPRDSRAQDGLDSNWEKLMQELRYTVALAGTSSPSYAAEARIVSAQLMQALSKASSESFRVIDRQNLEGRWPDHAVELGQGVDAVIVAELLEIKTMKQQTSTDGKSNYQAGTLLEEAPEYKQLKADYDKAADSVSVKRAAADRARYRYEDEKRAKGGNDNDPTVIHFARQWDTAKREFEEAEEEFKRIDRRLRYAPRWIEKPDIQVHTYPIYEVVLEGQVSCLLKMVDASTGELLFSEKLSAVSRASDKFVEPDARYNVSGNPLDLPDVATMKERAMAKLQEQIDAAVGRMSQIKGEKYRESANRAFSRGETERGIEEALRYLCLRGMSGRTDRSIIEKIKSSLGNQNDVIDVENVLRERFGDFGRGGK